MSKTKEHNIDITKFFDLDIPMEEIPVGPVKSHFLDSGSFTLWTKSAEYAAANKCGRYDYYDTDEFWQYCVAPETRILTADLRWVRADSLNVGDDLLGFDEHSPQKPQVGRNWRRSTVLNSRIEERPCYQLTFDDGTQIVCTREHKWLSASTSGRAEWIRTDMMQVGGKRASSVVKPIDVWDTESSWEAGYLAAGFDGEGCLGRSNARGRGNLHLSFAQKQNGMLAELLRCLETLQFNSSQYSKDSSVQNTYIMGGCREVLRFLGSIRPRRLLSKFKPEILGRMTLSRKTHRVKLVSRHYIGIAPVVVMKTSTRTFLANGLASHNCDSYAEFVKKYAVAIDYYANVDVIPNPELTWRNQQHLESKGLTPVPVVHYTTDLKWLAHYIDLGYPIVALGGLVGSTSQDECRAWIDRAFDMVCDAPDRLPKVCIHGFGVTSYDLLLRYPWWSVDSTSWTKVGAFGGILVPHKRGGKFIFTEQPYMIPISKDSPATKIRGRHFSTLSRAEKQVIQEWLDLIGVKLGKMEGEEITEFGVMTRHTERRVANLYFFELMRKSLPQYPWPFNSVRRKGFGLV